MKYLLKNSSPALRATCTLSTICRELRICWLSAASCDSLAACCLARSSADPPKRCRATTAITRWASRSRPMTARIPTRGSLTLCRLMPPGRLKFLGIIHRDPAPIKGLCLGGILLGADVHPVKHRGLFQRNSAFDDCLGFLRGHRDIQHHLVLGVDGRHQRHQFYVVRNGALEIGEQLAPTDSFVLEQGVDEDAVVQHIG